MQADLNGLRTLLGQYEAAQASAQEESNNLITAEIAAVRGEAAKHLLDTRAVVEAAVQGIHARLALLEREGEKGKNKKTKDSLLEAKLIVPQVFESEGWAAWRRDVEDYCEEKFEGVKDVLEKVRGCREEVDELWFGNDDGGWWNLGEALWRFLRRYTKGDARKAVQAARDDNGWEA